MEIVGYRWADYDTPLWSNPNRSPGRWHAVGDEPTQYWALHPLGPWAEHARAQHITEPDDLANISSRVWAARFELATGSVCRIDFDTASSFALNPAQLVGDDFGPCQQLARNLRSGYRGLIVPSAALPGTSNLVLFGPRAMSPYELDAPDDDLDVPTSLISEHGGPPSSLFEIVCHRGRPHAGLTAWRAGDSPPVVNPVY